MSLKEFAENKLGLVDSAIITAIDRRDDTDQKKHSYKVQFNPSELTIDASLPVKLSATAQAQAAEHPELNMSIPIDVGTPRIVFTTRLVFDEVNTADAFASGKVAAAASVSGAARGIGVAAKKAGLTGGADSDWSVQPIVEGFIGALRNVNTRSINFAWGEFSLTGILEHVNAEYVMFSPSGNPIRAFVTLRLVDDWAVDTPAWISGMQASLNTNPDTLAKLNAKKSAVSNVLNVSW
ncbi:MAG: hypothetical protein LBQ21_00675 [Clostridiales Family XIII bacterium]|jgi:hypothetical protein|nr:hypothetical protein [Clostridiales Family XIII bacterium]